MERNYRTLWWQHFLAIICFSVLPLILVALILYNTYDGIYTNKVEETLRNNAENRRDAIQLFLNERLSQVYMLAHTNTFSELGSEERLDQIFKIMQAKSNSYMDIGIINSAGEHVAYVGPYYNRLKSVNYHEETWFKAVMAHGFYLSDVFLGYRQTPHFIAAVSVRENKNTWIMRVTIDLKNIDDLLRRAWTAEHSDAFLINNRNALQTLSRFGGKFLEPPQCPDFSAVANTKVIRMDYEGKNSFYAVSPIPNTKWILVLKENPDEMLVPLQKGRHWTILCTAIGFLVIVTCTALFTNAIVNRIKATDEENAGNFNMLMQANKMISLSKMAAGVAHEVNNPLASIAEKAGWMKDLLLEEDIKNSESFQEFDDSINKIEEHVARARKVIQNLLGFARRMEPAKEKININNLLDETIGFLENEAKYANIELKKDYRDDIPIITSDLSQVQQVVLNLLNNAIDSISENGTVTVSSRYIPDAEEVRIRVADTGVGIPQERLNKIFDPFFTTKEIGKGTGLGLSISYSIIDKLGGKIQVMSKVGEGTAFTIILPKR